MKEVSFRAPRKKWFTLSGPGQKCDTTLLQRKRVDKNNKKKIFFFSFFNQSIKVVEILQKFRARFTIQGKLTRERNSKTAPMGMEISAGDLLTKPKLKNTDTTSHLHIDQSNIPSAAQISVVANKQSWCSSGTDDLLTTQAQLVTCNNEQKWM